MKHLDLPEQKCEIRFDHASHDWWGLPYRMVAGKHIADNPYAKHYMCPGIETAGRHKGEPDVELDSQTNRPEVITYFDWFRNPDIAQVGHIRR